LPAVAAPAVAVAALVFSRDGLVFAAGCTIIDFVWRLGRKLVRAGCHERCHAILDRYKTALRRIIEWLFHSTNEFDSILSAEYLMVTCTPVKGFRSNTI